MASKDRLSIKERELKLALYLPLFELMVRYTERKLTNGR
jgi:hypothetical protein